MTADDRSRFPADLTDEGRRFCSVPLLGTSGHHGCQNLLGLVGPAAFCCLLQEPKLTAGCWAAESTKIYIKLYERHSIMQKNPKKFMSNFHMRVSTKSPGFQRVCCSRNTKNVKDWNQLLRTVAVVKLLFIDQEWNKEKWAINPSAQSFRRTV